MSGKLGCRVLGFYDEGEIQKPEHITLEQAVNVLNERKHGDCETWSAQNGEAARGYPTTGDGWFTEYFSFTAFEATAIAEKYLREAAK